MRLVRLPYVLVTTFGLLVACRHASPGEPAAAAANQPPEALAEAASPTHGEHAPVAPAAEPEPVQVHYDLAAHLERAELRDGRSLVIDFGEPGAAKYTWGGWMSGTGDDHTFPAEGEGDGVTSLIIPGKVAKLPLPIDEAGAAQLTLRMRGLREGPLTVHLNGETVANLKLEGDDFQTLELELPAKHVKRGENLLQLRAHRTGSVRGVPKASMALDWARISPPCTPAAGAPPSRTALLDGAPGQGRLRVPAEHALGYSLQVPPSAKLQAVVRAEAGTRLEVVAVRDGGPAEPLASLTASGKPQPLRVDLGGLVDQVLRLDLRARGGDVVLVRPAVVVPPVDVALGDERPIKNVIVVLIDTLRADKLSPYAADTRVQTPGLSTFLKTAAVMTNARTQENWTKPSVATLLSSLLPWEHKAVTGDAKVPRSVELLPELLRDRGFYTGSFIANGYVSDKFGFKQGWHTYRNYIREGRRTKAQYVAADVLDWLDKRPQDKPFLLYMHTIDPHVPYRPPKSFVSQYADPGYNGKVEPGQTAKLLEKIKVGSFKPRKKDKRYLEALYDAEISYHDVHFAAVMEGLEKRGIADETMVVITSDHGEEFWDHGSVGHGHSVYDELLHIPLIVRIPGVTEGKQRIESAVGLVDIMPTILDALGQEIPEDLSGRSFLPELRGDTATAPRTAVAGFMKGWRTLAVGDLKYIQRTLSGTWLYDVAEDPGETEDLAKERPIALRYARGLLGLSLAQQDGSHTPAAVASGKRKGGPKKAKKKQHKQEKTVIDPETEKQLRALGYVGSSAK